jgi:four helix bundle protein
VFRDEATPENANFKTRSRRAERMTSRNYQDLVVWQKAMDLVEDVYKATRRFLKEEIYGLTAQLRRAAVSIPSNIAEGQGRRTARDFLNFLSIAYGSLSEVDTQVLIAQRLGYFDEQLTSRLRDLVSEVGKPLNGLMRSVEKKR